MLSGNVEVSAKTFTSSEDDRGTENRVKEMVRRIEADYLLACLLIVYQGAIMQTRIRRRDIQIMFMETAQGHDCVANDGITLNKFGNNSGPKLSFEWTFNLL